MSKPVKSDGLDDLVAMNHAAAQEAAQRNNQLEFLTIVTAYFGSKLTDVQKMVESGSIFSVIGFALKNIGFIWKHRKEISSFQPEMIEKVLMSGNTTNVKYADSRIKLIDNLMGNMDALSSITANLMKFLNAWFIPTKLILRMFPESYQPFLSSEKSPAIVRKAEPLLIKQLFDKFAQNAVCGNEFMRCAELIRGEKLKQFFNPGKLMNGGEKATELEVMGAIIGSLANYATAKNEIFRKFLADFIKEKMKDSGKFDELIQEFNVSTGAAVDFKPEIILKRGAEAQVALFELIGGLADIGDDLKVQLKEYMKEKEGRDNFTQIVSDTLITVLTHYKKETEGRVVYISGMSTAEGERLVEAFSRVIVQNLVTDNIVSGKFISFALKIMKGEPVIAEEISETLSQVNTLALSEKSQGVVVLIETIDAILPMLKSSPVVAKVLSRIAPGEKLNDFMRVFKPVLDSVLASGKLDDPCIVKITTAILVPPKEGEKMMTVAEMVHEIMKFTNDNPDLDKTVGKAIRDFTAAQVIPDMVGQAVGGFLEELVVGDAARKKRGTERSIGDGSTVSDQSSETASVDEDEDRGMDDIQLASNPTLKYEDAWPATKIMSTSKRIKGLGDFSTELATVSEEEELLGDEEEVGRVTQMVTDIVKPFVANAPAVYTELKKFNDIATRLFKAQKELLITPDLETKREEVAILKAQYRVELKAFIHLILKPENLAGLKKLEVSEGLQKIIAAYATTWAMSEPTRKGVLISLDMNEDHITEAAKILFPMIISLAKKSPESMASLLDLTDMVIDLDVNQPIDKLLASMQDMITRFTEITAHYATDPTIQQNIIKLFKLTKNNLALLIDSQLKAQLGSTDLIKGSDIVAILSSDLSPEKLSKVSEIITNLSDFVTKDKWISSIQFKLSSLDKQAAEIEERNESLAKLAASLFEFSDLAHKVFSKLNPVVLATIVTDTLTKKAIKVMSEEEIRSLIRNNLEVKPDIELDIEDVVHDIYSMLQGEEFEENTPKVWSKLVEESFEPKEGGLKSVKQVAEIIHEQLRLVQEGPLFDEKKVAKLAEFGLTPEELSVLMKETTSTMVELVTTSLDPAVKADMQKMLVRLMEIKPEEDIIVKLSDVFDKLYKIAEKKPEVRNLIDIRLKSFLSDNKELLKPIISVVLGKYQKSLNLVLYRSGISLDQIFEVVKSNFSLDHLHNVLGRLKRGGVGGYASVLWAIGKKAWGLSVSAVSGLVSSWFMSDAGRIAREFTNILKNEDLKEISPATLKSSLYKNDRLSGVEKEINERLKTGYFGALVFGSMDDKLKLKSKKVEGISFESITLPGIAKKTVLYLEAVNSEFKDCNFSNAKISGRFSAKSKVFGCSFYGAEMDNVAFKGVTFENVDLRSLDGRNVTFLNCTFKGCSFDVQTLRTIGEVPTCKFINNQFTVDCSIVDGRPQSLLTVAPQVTGLAVPVQSDHIIMDISGREKAVVKGEQPPRLAKVTRNEGSGRQIVFPKKEGALEKKTPRSMEVENASRVDKTRSSKEGSKEKKKRGMRSGKSSLAGF